VDLVVNTLMLIVGMVLLIGGAEVLVRGASSLAKRLKIRPLVIGLTVVAFGTSAPELAVNVLAAGGKPPSIAADIAFGNIAGSNIYNVLLILGVSGLICPLAVQKNTVWREIPFALLAVVILLVMVLVQARLTPSHDQFSWFLRLRRTAPPSTWRAGSGAWPWRWRCIRTHDRGCCC